MNALSEIKSHFSDVLSKLVDDPTAALGMIRPAGDPKFGDYQANGCMAAAKKLKTNPRQLAEVVLEKLDLSDIAEKLEIAGPGFINIFLKKAFLVEQLTAASDDEIRAAVDRIGAAEIFDGLPDGFATEVQERGSRLSAGEKQIVSLARAALVDPAILILDEATSSVDPGTEALVENAMDSLMRSRTVIVIAHRLSTAARCDRVGVVVDGRLAELGTHDELLAQGSHYTELFAAWSKS